MEISPGNIAVITALFVGISMIVLIRLDDRRRRQKKAKRENTATN